MFNTKTLVSFALLATTVLYPVSAFPVKREVPQEHSHNAVIATVRTLLTKNNPLKVQDPVFALLGDAAAKAGAGDVTNLDCLQQIVADQAFTNAKAAGDVDGQTQALIFRALERNTGKVGLASVSCTGITATNPEIAAISQHQDPASTGAAAGNKAIVLALAKQIASIGGNPQDALKSGTFAPGKIGDPTAKGNTCDVADDTAGCIFTQNLLVDDATADEIDAAVKGVASSATSNSSSSASAASNSSDSSAASSSNSSSAASDSTAAAAATETAAAAASTAASGSAAAGAINTGTKCPDASVIFGHGLGGRSADSLSFEASDQTHFQKGSALNAQVIFNAICNGLVNTCGFKNTDSTVTQCKSAITQAEGAGKNNGAVADEWNKLFGKTTNFAAVT